MDIFNVICGVCSIAGLLVSVFTASRVIKISNTFNYKNDSGNSKIKIKGSEVKDSVIGRNNK